MRTSLSAERTPGSTRADAIFDADLGGVRCRTDRVFAGLLVLEWFGAILAALWLSPRTWAGSTGTLHPHVVLAIWLQGLVAVVPVLLVLKRAGTVATRHTIALSQVLTSSILIHLTGGRIETHFHIFGSLAFLAFYRDWRVLITATAIVGLDHVLRGIYWPQSVYGVSTLQPWRWAEHAGWVVFEDVFLIYSCITGLREMKAIAVRQAEVERLHAGVEATVVERTAELEVARDRALKSLRAKSEFLARMSHEIRTPLNGVIGTADLLAASPLAPDQRDHLETMRTCSVGLHGLVNEILDYSRIEAGGLNLESIDFDVREVVDHAVEAVAPEASRKGLELISSVDAEVPGAVRGDPSRLRQVLMNLLGNAVKFTSAGHVAVRAKVATDERGVSQLRFSVSDTGIGIAPDARDGLFEPFTQADGSMTRRFGGSGLGLAISRRIVNLMGGQIEFTSLLGRGTEFTFVVPLLPGSPIPPEPEESACAGRRLLLVASEKERESVAEALRGLGVEISATDRVDTAMHRHLVACQADHPYDCILVDKDLPDMDGLEVGRRLLAIPVRDPPVLLLLSRSSDDRETHDAQIAGFAGVLPKPVRRARLVRRLASQAGGHPVSPQTIPLPALPSRETSPGSESVRILIAEDNLVNQRVVLKMIHKLGWSADIVENGRQAVEAVSKGTYAIVLMDCQMPEMNGYEATREIRKCESISGKRSWIIAFTANALQSDRDECEQAGMNDFLPKPVTLAKLHETLSRCPELDSSSHSRVLGDTPTIPTV